MALVMARICMTDGSTHRMLNKLGACGWLYVRVKAFVVAVVVVVVIVVVVVAAVVACRVCCCLFIFAFACRLLVLFLLLSE